MRGVVWTGLSVIVQLVVTYLFFKILSNEEMAHFDIGLRLVMFCQLLASLGMGPALVNFRAADERHFSAAFWTCLGFGLLLTVSLIGAAPCIAHFAYSHEFVKDPGDLEWILTPMALMIPFAAVSGIVRARLQRALHFASIALSEMIAVLLAALVGLITYFAGYPLWSPVLNAFGRESILLVALWGIVRQRIKLQFQPAALGRLMPFALNTTGAQCVDYLRSNIDLMAITFFMQDANLYGLYLFGYRFTMMPLTRLATTVARVSFPALASIQEDDARLRRAYLKSVQSIALVAWPPLVGMLVFAPDILLGTGVDKLPALDAFRLLCVAAFFRSVGTVAGSVFLAKGKANWAFHWTLFSVAALAPAFYLAHSYQIEGIAAVVALFAFIFLPLSQYLVNRLIGLSFSAYLTVFIRPLLVCLMLLAVFLLANPFLSGGPFLRLALAVALGMIAYPLALRLFAWDLLAGYWQNFTGKKT
jgi:O-antigen/teichoic acid export membrane protein